MVGFYCIVTKLPGEGVPGFMREGLWKFKRGSEGKVVIHQSVIKKLKPWESPCGRSVPQQNPLAKTSGECEVWAGP